MTIWTMMLIMALVACLALLVMRAVPVYLNDMKVRNAVEKVASDPELADASGRALQSALQRWAGAVLTRDQAHAGQAD